MKKKFLWVWLLLKRQLKNPAVVIFLIGMPIVAAIFSNIPDMTQTQVPRVGIVANAKDELSKRILNQLLNGEYSVEFYESSDYESLKEDVRSGRTECGYVLDNNLSEKYKRKNYNNTILQVQNNSDFIPSMAKEMVFAAVFSVYAKDMAIDYVEKSQLFDRNVDRAKQLIVNSYDKYLGGTSTFHMRFSRLEDADSNNTIAIENTSVAFPIRGIIAILIYLAGLFGCVSWKMDEEKGMFLTLPYGFRIASRPVYSMIPTVLFALSGEITMIIAGTVNVSDELWKMPLYVISVILFSWLLNIIIPSSKGVVSVIPVLLIASMVLCPIFVNVLTTVPAAKYFARLLLPYYYLL